VVVTRGHMSENATNLADSFLALMKDKYEGTRLGRQELAGDILDDNPHALWKREQIEADRVVVAPALQRIVVAVDPSITDTGDEAGIIAAGKGFDEHYYCLDDASLQASPDGWARVAVNLFRERKADRLIFETNQGGQMVTLTVKAVDSTIPTRGIHASRGKITRAEPISALSEQHRIHHVGTFPLLEDELCNYDGSGPSPNRLDAYVYALTELHQRAPGAIIVR
jgi:phage terminase large subunit-like protein